MTTRFKDFGAETNVNREPLSFKLYGEEFHCRTALQGKVLLDTIKGADSENPSAAASMIEDFFKVALVEESYDRFQNLLNDPDRIVTVETLSEITGWLVSEYSSRPTQGPEHSSNGQ